jgi:hypothetical protein
MAKHMQTSRTLLKQQIKFKKLFEGKILPTSPDPARCAIPNLAFSTGRQANYHHETDTTSCSSRDTSVEREHRFTKSDTYRRPHQKYSSEREFSNRRDTWQRRGQRPDRPLDKPRANRQADNAQEPVAANTRRIHFDIECYYCNEKGRYARSCPKRGRRDRHSQRPNSPDPKN